LNRYIYFLLLTWSMFFLPYNVSSKEMEQKYVFFLHNKFVELFDLQEMHPEYGKAEYHEILEGFRQAGFVVISEKRPKDTDMKKYASKVVHQIDSLIRDGVKPGNITVVGTSKGGYIAQYVSTFLRNPKLNFVLVGCYQQSDLSSRLDIRLCGNILSIYEKTDSFGVSMKRRIEVSGRKIPHFKEMELHTGLKHGFLYHPLDEWMQPAIQWANGNYNVLTTAELKKEVDAILKSRPDNPFNGIVLIKEADSIVYSSVQGYSDIEKMELLSMESQFVTGSISKQFTAVLALQEIDKMHLRLDDKIGKYLTSLKQSWKDSVTVYQLLTHTHGIVSLHEPLQFEPGSRMDYPNGNNIGYQLLSEIIEKCSGKGFDVLSMELFHRCGMNGTFHPSVKQYKQLASGYTQTDDGNIVFDKPGFDVSPAAGSFVSTAGDLIIWNEQLHGGKLLKSSSYKLMTTIQPHVIRQHPVWGVTEYGLGMTICDKENLLQLGQTGLVPGFASMDFYFPEQQISVVLLQNLVYKGSTKDKFYYHTQISALLRKKLRNGQETPEKKFFPGYPDSLPYRLIYPKDEKPEIKYPLIVYLHGSGLRGSENEMPLAKLPLQFTDSLHRKGYPCYILIPQCPANDAWVLFPNFPIGLASTVEATPVSKNLVRLIHHITETRNIDTTRIYLTGFSLGGEGTFDLLARNPAMFACGVPIASVADTSRASMVTHIPIWAFHGSADTVNPVMYSQLMIEAIRKHGGRPKYTEFNGLSHSCQSNVYKMEALWKWMFEQKKEH
jgi:D-alanyl-D-alanine carboxypeptidase